MTVQPRSLAALDLRLSITLSIKSLDTIDRMIESRKQQKGGQHRATRKCCALMHFGALGGTHRSVTKSRRLSTFPLFRFCAHRWKKRLRVRKCQELVGKFSENAWPAGLIRCGGQLGDKRVKRSVIPKRSPRARLARTNGKLAKLPCASADRPSG